MLEEEIIIILQDNDFDLSVLREIKKLVDDKIDYIQFGHCKKCGNEIKKENAMYCPVGMCKFCFDKYDDKTKQKRLADEQDAIFDYVCG